MSYSRDEIVSNLEALSNQLEEQGIHGEMFVVGGAAMALAYNRRRTTRDLDTVFEPKMLIYQAAKRVAEMRHLEPDWLETDGGKDIYAGPDPQAETVLNLPALSVSVAFPRYLFALKALAWQDRDIDDLKILYNLCGFASVDDAISYVGKVYSGRPVEVRVAFVLREIFQNDGFDG